jgi:hypothetical protein
MRVKISELNMPKINEFAIKTVKNDPNLLQNRQFFTLFAAPRAIVEFRGIYYLPTAGMDPIDAEKHHKYTNLIDPVSIPIHPLYPGEEGQLEYSQVPAFRFAATIEELLEEWSTPLQHISLWFHPETLQKWVRFFYLTEKANGAIIEE